MHCLTSKGNWELRIDFTFSNGIGMSLFLFSHLFFFPAIPVFSTYFSEYFA